MGGWRSRLSVISDQFQDNDLKFRLDSDDTFLILAPRWADLGSAWQIGLLALMLVVPLLMILCLYRYELRLVSRLRQVRLGHVQRGRVLVHLLFGLGQRRELLLDRDAVRCRVDPHQWRAGRHA